MLSSSHEASDEDEDVELESVKSGKLGKEEEKEVVHRCDYPDCGKSFEQRKYLAKHIRGVHKGKPYKCKRCEARFEFDRAEA